MGGGSSGTGADCRLPFGSGDGDAGGDGSGALTETHTMPISSGIAAKFSRRNTLFSEASLRTRLANASLSSSSVSCPTNSTDVAMGSLTSRTASSNGSRDNKFAIRACTAAQCSSSFLRISTILSSTPSSGGSASAGLPSASGPGSFGGSGGGSGGGEPMCAVTSTASGVISRTDANPASFCFACSRASLGMESRSSSGLPPSALMSKGARKPRSAS
mmetsp:Transcript_3107/g.7966  ORF Transcript_3107/g.7966 Transcript_3107/m.7966 type:complete len:217 (-) Transcript_3107:566-1216(-)